MIKVLEFFAIVCTIIGGAILYMIVREICSPGLIVVASILAFVSGLMFGMQLTRSER